MLSVRASPSCAATLLQAVGLHWAQCEIPSSGKAISHESPLSRTVECPPHEQE